MVPPLASFPIVSTTDPDEAQTVLSRELSGLRFKSVTDVARFRLEMNGVRFGRTMVGFNEFASASQVDAGVIENAVIVSVSVGRTPAILDLDGEKVGADKVGIVSPERHTIIHRACGSGVVVLRADMAAIEQRFREITGKEASRPDSVCPRYPSYARDWRGSQSTTGIGDPGCGDDGNVCRQPHLEGGA